MYVSNLTNRRLGLVSPIVLRPNEVNRFVDDDNKKLIESVLRAKAAGLVSVSEASGMVKTIAATAVKTLTFDAGAVGTEPRSVGAHAEAVKAVLKERVLNGTENVEVLKEVAAKVEKELEAKEEVAEVKEEVVDVKDEVVNNKEEATDNKDDAKFFDNKAKSKKNGKQSK